MSHLLQLVNLTDLDLSWLARFFSLVILPFADEDFAIIFGGYFVVNKLMPVGLVAATIYVGMLASDFAFYGIGAAARRVKWLARWAVDDRVKSFADTLRRNLFELVALCRVVPGLDLIAFIACGWMRVPFARFMLASVVISALYLPLMLYLVIVFGDALDDHAGLWTWPALVAIAAVAGFVRNRIFSLRGSTPATAGVPSGTVDAPPAAPTRSRFRVYQSRHSGTWNRGTWNCNTWNGNIWPSRLTRLPIPRPVRWFWPR